MIKIGKDNRYGFDIEGYLGGFPVHLCRQNYEFIPFGKFTDKYIANSLYIPLSRITKERQSRGIPVFHGCKNSVNWENVPFEERSNAYISRMLDIPEDFVFRKRRKLKRPKDRMEKIKVDWESIPLGEVDDRIIFERNKTKYKWFSVGSVVAGRSIRGIRSFWEWSVDWDKLPLGRVQDSYIARSLRLYGFKGGSMHCPVSEVSKQRKLRGLPPAISTVKCLSCGDEIRTMYPLSVISCGKSECRKVIEKANGRSSGFKQIRPIMIGLVKLENEIHSAKKVQNEN